MLHVILYRTEQLIVWSVYLLVLLYISVYFHLCIKKKKPTVDSLSGENSSLIVVCVYPVSIKRPHQVTHLSAIWICVSALPDVHTMTKLPKDAFVRVHLPSLVTDDCSFR